MLRVSLTGICPNNKTPIVGLYIRKNTEKALIFRITRHPIFRIEFIPDRICPVNQSRNQGSRYPEFRLTRPHCITLSCLEHCLEHNRLPANAPFKVIFRDVIGVVKS